MNQSFRKDNGFHGFRSALRKPNPAFTLIELMVVVAMIGILAGLLLPALSQAKAKARSIQCRSNLHQMALTLRMYVDDFNHYPYFCQYNPGDIPRYIYERVGPYSAINWTNPSAQCPSYKGARYRSGYTGISYAYNACGPSGNLPRTPASLGLGGWDTNFISGRFIPPVSESQVQVPGEMYAMADAFGMIIPGAREWGALGFMWPWMAVPGNDSPGWCGGQPFQKPTQHGRNVNVLFCDGHVTPVRTLDFLDPKKTASNWSSDRLPHADEWWD